MSYTGDLLSVTEAHAHFEMYKDPPPVVRTSLGSLNQICRGFGQRKGFAMGWYVVIGGDTGQGKSMLALQMAMEASEQGVIPGFLSFEMAEYELRNRFYSQALKVPSQMLEPGENFSEATAEMVIQRLRDRRDLDPGANFYVTDDLVPDVSVVVGKMEMWLNIGVQLFVVDYLQLLEDRKTVGMAQEVQKISAAMRDFAHHNQVVVIALSQYNNEGGNDRTRPPHVGHLYGGRRISQDSDMTILLDHSRYERDRAQSSKARTWMLVPKNRHGPSGVDIPIEWDYTLLKAREGMPDEINLWPGGDQ
jgi:replicative DNA helicase